jgi:AraC-like DNA-binding protein
LALSHRDIARRWTVDDLSREVGLSRSALADRFIRLIGVPPMHYLANWRMQVATQKLRSTSASLAQIAEIIGYESEAAFSRAFKKAFGAAPTAEPTIVNGINLPTGGGVYPRSGAEPPRRYSAGMPGFHPRWPRDWTMPRSGTGADFAVRCP